MYLTSFNVFDCLQPLNVFNRFNMLNQLFNPFKVFKLKEHIFFEDSPWDFFSPSQQVIQPFHSLHHGLCWDWLLVNGEYNDFRSLFCGTSM